MHNQVYLLFVSIFLFWACSSSKDIPQTEVPSSLADKVMIELRPDVDANTFAASFKAFGLERKYLASKSQNLHMFVFDTETIAIKNLIKKIGKRKEVVSVEALSDQLKVPQQQSNQQNATNQMK